MAYDDERRARGYTVDSNAPAGSAAALGIAQQSPGSSFAQQGQAMLEAARPPAPPVADPAAAAAARIIEKGKQQAPGYVAPPARASGFNAGQALSTANSMANDSLAARFPNATRVLDQARTDIAAAPDAASTAGQVVRGVLAAPVGFAADLYDKAKAAVQPVVNAGYTAFTGNNAPIVGPGAPAVQTATTAAPAPAVAAAPAAVAPAGGPGLPGGTTANTTAAGASAAGFQPQLATSTVSDAPGVTKIVDAAGRTTYTDQGTAGYRPAGTISRQNEAAAAALDGRSRAEAAALAARGQAPVDPGSQLFVAPYTRDERMQVTPDLRGLSARQRANFAQQEAERAQRGDIAAQGFQVQREGQAIAARGQDLQAGAQAARLGFDTAQAQRTGQLTDAQAAEARTRTQGQQDVLAARAAYDAALQGGDKKAIGAAEKRLRAAQGRYEREDNFSVTSINGGIDPVTGQPRGAGAVILNRETGDARFVAPAEAQGAQQPQQQFTTGKVYVDGKGNKAKWDGKQFVPQ